MAEAQPSKKRGGHAYGRRIDDAFLLKKVNCVSTMAIR